MWKNIKSGIYCIENLTTNKKYIGQSVDVDGRWSKHKGELNHGTHDNDYLQKAWNKYSENDFKFYILEYCDHSELDEREIYYIDFYNTLDRDWGYNLKSGGQTSGGKPTDYVRQKQSEALKQSYRNNDELRNKRRQDALQQWADPEIKQKIMGENNGMYGKHHSEEVCKRIGEKMRGNTNGRGNNTPVICVELNRLFENARIAANEFSCQSGTILRACRNEKYTCSGYHWKFIGE